MGWGVGECAGWGEEKRCGGIHAQVAPGEQALGLWQDLGLLAGWAGAARWAGRPGGSAAAVAVALRGQCRDCSGGAGTRVLERHLGCTCSCT